MAANPRYAVGEVIANKYVVEGPAGESPAGRAYLANGHAGRLAIKVYRPEVSAALLAAPDFFLKAAGLSEIAHDNLAACLEVQEEMGLVYAARAYAEGDSFEDWDRRHRGGPGHFTRGLELLWQASQGLAALHERTRHLNIHPGNLIVGPMVAKLCDPDPRALGNTEMTPAPLPLRPEYAGYRAPEVHGRGAGFLSYPSSDLFAIGGLLYRLVKGAHPHADPARTLSETRGLDREVALFLGKALHPRPEERFQEAGAFADALWELQAAMRRLQERPEERPSAPARATQSGAGPAAEAFAIVPGPMDATEVGAPVKAKAPDDSFFDFSPAEPAAAGSAAQATAPSSPRAAEPLPSGTPASAGDTLFGVPVQRPPATEARGGRARPGTPDAIARGGLGELEQSGTSFGAPPDRGPAPKVPPREASPVPKPLAVSLSSLEKDPMEAAGSGDPGGFTAYGFQGAGDNRTGIYNPDGQAAAAKAKLRLLLGITGAVVVLAGLGILFLVLRGNAAGGAGPASARAAEPGAPASAIAPAAATEPPVAEAAVPAGTGRPAAGDARPDRPDPAAAPAAAEPTSRARPEAHPAKADGGTGYSDPPMPVEPPRPGSAPRTAQADPAAQGNSHVSPAREAELMAMIQARNWPTTAVDRLKAADELNDLGKIAEANLLYGKALATEGATEKQRIAALGGLAVTFQSMGMRDQARDAVEKLLAINPKNAFALKLKGKLD